MIVIRLNHTNWVGVIIVVVVVVVVVVCGDKVFLPQVGHTAAAAAAAAADLPPQVSTVGVLGTPSGTAGPHGDSPS